MSDFMLYLKEKYPNIDFENIIHLFFYELKQYMSNKSMSYFKISNVIKIFKSSPVSSTLKVQVNNVNITEIKNILKPKVGIYQINLEENGNNFGENSVYNTHQANIKEEFEDVVIEGDFNIDDLF